MRGEQRFAGDPVRVSDLVTVAREAGVFPHVFRSESANGQSASLGRTVLNRHVGRTVGGAVIERLGQGSTAAWKLTLQTLTYH